MASSKEEPVDFLKPDETQIPGQRYTAELSGRELSSIICFPSRALCYVALLCYVGVRRGAVLVWIGTRVAFVFNICLNVVLRVQFVFARVYMVLDFVFRVLSDFA